LELESKAQPLHEVIPEQLAQLAQLVQQELTELQGRLVQKV
jgi:hypothetical protein